MTNQEWIRTADKEEIARMLTDISTREITPCDKCFDLEAEVFCEGEKNIGFECVSGWYNWLEAEHEED